MSTDGKFTYLTFIYFDEKNLKFTNLSTWRKDDLFLIVYFILRIKKKSLNLRQKPTILSLRVCQPDEKYIFFTFNIWFLRVYRVDEKFIYFPLLFDEILREYQLTKSLLIWRLFMLTTKSEVDDLSPWRKVDLFNV